MFYCMFYFTCDRSFTGSGGIAFREVREENNQLECTTTSSVMAARRVGQHLSHIFPVCRPKFTKLRTRGRDRNAVSHLTISCFVPEIFTIN